MVGQVKYGLESVSCCKQGIEAFTKCRQSQGFLKFIGYKTRIGYFIGKRKLRRLHVGQGCHHTVEHLEIKSS